MNKSSYPESVAIHGIPNEYGKKIPEVFHPLPNNTVVILFGSRAKGTHREGSDIDIAIKGPDITYQHRDAWLLKYDQLNLPWKLDLVIYHHIQERALIDHIDRVGIQILGG